MGNHIDRLEHKTKLNRMKNLLAFLFCIVVLSATAQLPKAPKGFKWVKNEKFTDEFNGDELDKSKWYDRSPYWVNGRAPATFRARTVSVKNGFLQIKNDILRKEDKEKQEKYNIVGGAVGSVAKDGHYGYYESRIKASGISMSTTFWMKNKSGGGSDCWHQQDELDIVEVVGMQKLKNDFRNILHSNTHIFRTECNGERNVVSAGGNCKIIPAADKAFHVYGCWWEDANNIHIYLDGEFQFTMHPDTTYSKTPFDKPMYMHLVTETYNWEEPPTPEELANDKINTSYYDWVRSYTLVKEN